MATYNVSPEDNAVVKGYADRIGVPPEVALSKMIASAHSRHKSLKKYYKKETPKAKKKVAVKGPLARKTKPRAKKVVKAVEPTVIPVV